jgi:hypothetical protein
METNLLLCHGVDIVSCSGLFWSLRIAIHNLLNPLVDVFIHFNILIQESIFIDHSILRVSAKLRTLLGGPGDGESLDIFELPKDEEEEAHDRVVAALFPQNDWVADIVNLTGYHGSDMQEMIVPSHCDVRQKSEPGLRFATRGDILESDMQQKTVKPISKSRQKQNKTTESRGYCKPNSHFLTQIDKTAMSNKGRT